jgi:hypothetical protein
VPLLVDRSLGARGAEAFWGGKPERRALLSPLEPYDVVLPPALLDPDGGAVIVHPLDGWGIVRIATAAAYLWNPETYHPEDALWRYLVTRCGIERAARLVREDRPDSAELAVCGNEPADR